MVDRVKLIFQVTSTTPHPSRAKSSFMEDVEEMIIASKPSTTAKRSAKVRISFAFLIICHSLSLSSLLISIGSFTGVPVNHKNKSAMCTCPHASPAQKRC